MTDPQASADLSGMIRATGGVPVLVPEGATWGHVDAVDREDWDMPDRTDRRKLVAVPAVAIDPAVGASIRVDGELTQVLDYRTVEDGRLVEIVFGDWTHVVDLYRASEDGTFTRGQQQTTLATVASGVRCDLWAVDGELRRREYASEAVGDWEGRVPPGIDVRPDDRVRVVEGSDTPGRFRVTFVGDRYVGRRIPVSLTESPEDFG